MKKIIASLIIAALSIIAIAQNTQASTKKCNYLCPQKPYPIANSFSRGLQTVSGLDFLVTKVAEGQIAKQLSKIGQGDFDVDIDTYSAMDLAAGKFKSIKINAQNVVIQNMYLTSLNLKSLCDFIYIDYKSKPARLLENLKVGFDGVISEADLNKTVSTPEYKEKLSNLKLTFLGQNIMSLDNAQIHIKNGRLNLAGTVQMPGFLKSLSMPLEISSATEITNNKIRLKDTQVSSGGAKVDINIPGLLLDAINPVLFGLQVFEKDGRKINMEKITIDGDKLNIKGNITIPKTL